MTKAVFAGFDASGHYNLWLTDGTPGGTGEISVIGAATSGLLISGFSDFTVLGNRVLFDGVVFERHRKRMGDGWHLV